MSTDIVLSADEIATAANYLGIFNSVSNFGLATKNSKKWFSASSSTATLPITLPSSARKIIGFRYLMDTVAEANILDLLHPSGGVSCTFNVKASGALGADGRGGGQGPAEILTPNTGLIQSNVEHFIEIDITVGDTGNVDIWVDGVQELDTTTDTKNDTADTGIGLLRLVLQNTRYIRDLYCLSIDGVGVNARLGPGRAERRRPNAAGNANQWAKPAAPGDATSYQEVDDTDPDDDTTYLKSSTVGEKDTFGYEDLTGVGGTVGAVCQFLRGRKDDAATRILHMLRRSSGGTEAEGADLVMAMTYGWFWEGVESEPGGAAWTRAKFDAAEFGRITDT